MKVNKQKPVSPGVILEEDFIIPLDLTREKVSKATGIKKQWIDEIIEEKRSITPDIAAELGKYFHMTSKFWLNLQARLDLWKHKNK